MTFHEIELLQRAAKAVGFKYRQDLTLDGGLVIDGGVIWNPLYDGNHAISLAAETQLFSFHFVRFHQILINCIEEGMEADSAIRNAIVQTVAERSGAKS